MPWAVSISQSKILFFIRTHTWRDAKCDKTYEKLYEMVFMQRWIWFETFFIGWCGRQGGGQLIYSWIIILCIHTHGNCYQIGAIEWECHRTPNLHMNPHSQFALMHCIPRAFIAERRESELFISPNPHSNHRLQKYMELNQLNI